MKLAISNIAWPGDALGEAIGLAVELGLDGIELAPYNLFRGWDVAEAEVRAVHTRIEDAGLVCPALQGILFNAPGVALFDSDETRRALAAQLRLVARMAGLLGAKACVFGAPKQRDPGDLSADKISAIARDFFRDIGPVFVDHGSALAIEANARAYACRFLTTTADAVRFVAEVDTPGIGLQIDTGTLFLEAEDPAVLTSAASLAVHAHVSEPQLQPIGSTDLDHLPIAAALRASGYDGVLSIEMRAVDDWQATVRHAVGFVRSTYT